MIELISSWPRATWWKPAIRIAALVAPLATCAVLSTVRDEVTAATSVLMLVVWVVAASATGDRLAGFLAAVSSGAWYDFFLTEPYLRFTIADPDDVEATVLLLVIGLLVSEIALWGYRQQSQAARRSGYLEGVLGAARSVSQGDTPTRSLVDVVARYITEALDADETRYVAGPVHDARIAVLDHDGVLTRNGRPVDVDRVGLPFDEYVAVPVRRDGRVVGHFLVSASSKLTYPNREQRWVAVLLADQVAAAVTADGQDA
jgi:K+-sensing histidine kinase KdpD